MLSALRPRRRFCHHRSSRYARRLARTGALAVCTDIGETVDAAGTLIGRQLVARLGRKAPRLSSSASTTLCRVPTPYLRVRANDELRHTPIGEIVVEFVRRDCRFASRTRDSPTLGALDRQRRKPRRRHARGMLVPGSLPAYGWPPGEHLRRCRVRRRRPAHRSARAPAFCATASTSSSSSSAPRL